MSESPDPQSVGRELVRQYYTMLNERPECLHRFFSHNSSYVHGGIEKPGEELPPVKGQVAIHQKIMSLGFKDCHAKIRQVDCQETVAGAVVIQVTGELSNNYGPMRRFMQTFVLARQSPKTFYLHNDIFRYQDEVFHDYDLVVDATENHEALDNHVETLATEVTYNAPTSLATPASSLPTETDETDEAASFNAQPATETAGNTLTSAVETLNVNEVSSEAPIVDTPVASATEETNNDNKPESSEASDVEPRAKLPVQKPISWASLAGKGTTSASSTVSQMPAASKPQATIKPERKDTGATNQTQNQPLPQRPMRSGNRNEQPVIGDSPAERKWPSSYDSSDSKSSAVQLVPDAQQLFVGNIPHNAEDKDLIEFFSKFGTVVDVKINRKGMTRDLPNFGFVSFDAPEAVAKALAGKPLLLYGRHRLNVEEKKEQSELFSRPRGGGRGGRGMNPYRGSYRGGRGGQFSAPVQSGESSFNTASH